MFEKMRFTEKNMKSMGKMGKIEVNSNMEKKE